MGQDSIFTTHLMIRGGPENSKPWGKKERKVAEEGQ